MIKKLEAYSSIGSLAYFLADKLVALFSRLFLFCGHKVEEGGRGKRKKWLSFFLSLSVYFLDEKLVKMKGKECSSRFEVRGRTTETGMLIIAPITNWVLCSLLLN